MEISSWQEQLKQANADPQALLRDLGLQTTQLPFDAGAVGHFAYKAPAAFLQRIEKNSPEDPLLRQVLPSTHEHIQEQGFSRDPVGDLDSEKIPGLLHKYQGRVLLVTTGACAIHCRYCFRQHFPYQESHAGKDGWQAALDYIRADASISEVILSGGDPLVLADSKLSLLLNKLEAIPHLRRLRLHSRMPVVVPARINNAFLDLFQHRRLKTVMVLHTNHANEIDDEVRRGLRELRAINMVLLNQSVLLKGVNDSWQELARLSETLFESNVLPYYLHMLDKVEGAVHFAVEEERALEIMHALRLALPGYLVPRLVSERAGAPYKIPLL